MLIISISEKLVLGFFCHCLVIDLVQWFISDLILLHTVGDFISEFLILLRTPPGTTPMGPNMYGDNDSLSVTAAG